MIHWPEEDTSRVQDGDLPIRDQRYRDKLTDVSWRIIKKSETYIRNQGDQFWIENIIKELPWDPTTVDRLMEESQENFTVAGGSIVYFEKAIANPSIDQETKLRLRKHIDSLKEHRREIVRRYRNN